MAKIISTKFVGIVFNNCDNQNSFDELVDEVEKLNAQRDELDALVYYAERNALTKKKIDRVKQACNLVISASVNYVRCKEFEDWAEDNGLDYQHYRNVYMGNVNLFEMEKKDGDDEYGESLIINQ